MAEYDDNGFYEISSEAAATPIQTASGEKTLMLQTRIVFTYGEGERDEANARLIAAAPDLLEALKRLSDQCDRMRLPGQHMTDAEESAKTAIAKATGEPK